MCSSPVPYVFVPGSPAAPTLLLLHGTGGDEHDMLPIAPHLLRGAAVLSPRGEVLEQGLPRFFRRLAEGVFDEEDVVRRSAELADFVGAASAHGLDPGRLVAVGFSNGAAGAVALLHPGVLRDAVLLAAMPVLAERLPEPLPDLGGLPVLLATGERDPIAPPAVAPALADTLTSVAARVQVLRHPGGHGVDASVLAAASRWLAGVLAGPAES
jgi:phospholipase/carboxylesterase